MSDYTPTTEHVRNFCAGGAGYIDGPSFDRWLAADRKAQRADAWDESAEATAEWMAHNPRPSGVPHDPPRNPYREEAQAALRARADRIEAGDHDAE